jgi:predicted TIM-barrel fold metal-dependent hydrolase
MLLRRREVLALAAAAAIAPNAGFPAQSKPASQRLRIVDAQVRIWSGGTPTPTQRQQPVSKDQLLLEMDEAGVDRAVIVPASWDPLGNQLAIQAAQAHPDRFAVMGLLNIAEPQNVALLDTWKKQPGMLGARIFLGTPQAAEALKDGTTDWFWAGAERADLAVMVHAGGVLDAMAGIAKRHPRLRLCIDSLGAPARAKDAAAFADLPKLLALAKLPNVAVKAEGVPTLSSEPYPHSNLHPFLHQVYDVFGPQRLFWGSDVTRLKTTSYKETVTLFTEALPWLSDRDRELIMGRALSKWIAWPLPN